MKIFYWVTLLCAAAAITLSAAQTTGGAASTVAAASASDTAAIDTSDTALKASMEEAAASFMRRYGVVSADSLERMLRSDYMLCTGDSSRISRERLFRWRSQVDSTIMHGNYSEMFRMFVTTTGIKAHEVRPCEPIVFYERVNRQIHETDSIISAQRAAREKAREDSMRVVNELRRLRANPADILGIPAGMSRPAVQTILARNRIRTTSAARHLQAERVMFDSLVVTIAFYFDEEDIYTGYEVETTAMNADQLDTTVRGWANQLARAYEKRLGPPSSRSRVSFRDIRQGRLSITTRWEKGESRPRVLVGLATHNHLYYAKVMVSY
ncbi:MAG: hypothetical protein LBC70_09965 [Chitinispirillales bacterium]|jgi:hypothetical protein|nr:hypothetical protein [Chitinispirillales bacterium]